MSNHDTLRVELGARSYDILVGSNLLADTAKYIAPFVKKAGVVVISDAVVAKHHLAKVLTSLDGAGIAHREVIVPSGEKSKSFAVFEDVVEQTLAMGIERSTLIIALGGGVVGDLAGYVAASLLRGSTVRLAAKPGSIPNRARTLLVRFISRVWFWLIQRCLTAFRHANFVRAMPRWSNTV